jgi:hypothetical protein
MANGTLVVKRPKSLKLASSGTGCQIGSLSRPQDFAPDLRPARQLTLRALKQSGFTAICPPDVTPKPPRVLRKGAGSRFAYYPTNYERAARNNLPIPDKSLDPCEEEKLVPRRHNVLPGPGG